MKKTHLWTALLLVGVFVFAQPFESAALIVDVVGKDTTVTLTSFDTLTGQGIRVSPLGSATVNAAPPPPQITFPITGGTFDTTTSNAVIKHDGSGFRLDKSTSTIKLQDFVINTNINQVTGDVAYGFTNVQDVPIFTIANTSELRFTKQAADAVYASLGVPDLTGFTVGTAKIDLRVPEPSILLLLGIGLFGLAAYRRS